MPIPISNYVAITSGIGAASNVSTRNLGALIITGNALVPTGVVKNFTSAADVGTYFGTGSEEYARAEFYFGWVSKDTTVPQQISFWFWNDDAATADLIYGASATYALATFTAITSGELDLTMGGFTHTITGINLGSAGSLAAVAADIQTAIQAYSAGGAAWTGATVAYDSTNSRFTLIGGATGADTIAVTTAVSNDLAGPLGWLTGAILSNGTAAQSIATNLNELISVSNNFGSFTTTFALALTLSNTTAAATWNNSLTPNIQFIYSVNVTPANASTWNAALANIGGVSLTLQSPAPVATAEYPEMAPMMILAATDYTQRNSVQNYMFQQFALTPSVTTSAFQQTYDALLINYYGQTQTAGQLLSFYQRGVMLGLPVNPSDQNVYADEIWFKDALGAALMNLLLALSQVPANAAGQVQILSTLQSIINQALFNGTISVGKTLSVNQQLYIAQVTGSSTAWKQVQNIGYWVNVVIEPYVVDGVTEYKAVYTLIYSKDDDIRLIQGSDILI
ncbi:DUF3383 family protein [Fimbriiglobus ruber]|uniref:Phage protein n=1 Tax=Fimbriiglobus ruber TaxID=1908690 RepID=A0A225DXU0_9BACT|nr:DUF3383 family protein [Fimbriiglobus ruber]OWK42059.1 hypothetical protein FRUB_04137 [Fimbriiglobus ruber]